jgi:hypothetical protein
MNALAPDQKLLACPSTAARLAHAGLLSMLLAALAGCTGTPLHFNDNGAPSYSVRGVVRPFGTGGIEVEASSVRGKGPQTLGSNESTLLNGQTFNGPADLAHSGRANHFHVAYNHLLFADRPFQMEWFAGASLSQLSWKTETGRASFPLYERRQSRTGAFGGVAGRWQMNGLLSVEGRVWAAGRDVAQARDYQNGGEVVLAITPAPGLRVRLGLAQSETGTSLLEGNGPRLQMQTRGPLLGLTLAF